MLSKLSNSSCGATARRKAQGSWIRKVPPAQGRELCAAPVFMFCPEGSDFLKKQFAAKIVP